jgi:DUF4097 and DUF4098 domain-containing protein YvlB
MSDKSYQLGPSPRVSFDTCVGDLRVQGWDREEVQLRFRSEDGVSDAQQVDADLTITGPMPKAANVPAAASVLLRNCAGDVHATGFATLRIEQHQGDLDLQHMDQVDLKTVHGDIQACEVRSLQVAAVHGDLHVQAVAEALAVAGVHGDIVLRAAQGQLAVKDVTGDVVARNPVGQLDVRNVTGDVALSGNIQTGDYHLEALSDVALDLDTASDARLEAEAQLGRIACGLALAETAESAHKLSGKLGQGTAHIQVVTLSGDIRLRPLGADRVRHEMEKERIWTEVHARRAADRARRLAEKAEAHAAKVRRWHLEWQTPAPGAAAPRRQERVSPETLQDERLAILKMLAEGKISAEQADSLLSALEG